MAEHRSLPRRKNGRHPSPLIAERGVSDGVDAAVHAEEAAGLNSASHSGGTQPDAPELGERDDAVLLVAILATSALVARFLRIPEERRQAQCSPPAGAS